MNGINQNLFPYFATTLAFAFFIVCPRMAAMTNILTKYSQLSIYWVVTWGTIVSLPFLVLTAWAIRQWGLMAGLAIAIVTDLFAALILKPIHIKAAVETFVIALFVVSGARFASWVTAKFF